MVILYYNISQYYSFSCIYD